MHRARCRDGQHGSISQNGTGNFGRFYVAAKQEWEPYKVGKPSTRSNWTNDDCRPFDEVSHVSHVDAAVRIVLDGRIRQSLVFDESVLNRSRVLVTWLSPNDWSNGFRYGNIRFTYGFADLIKDMQFYWVEAITAYSPTACRILITDQDRSRTLKPYDPAAASGPWWHDKTTDTHYLNGKLCLEFMIEADLPLRKVRHVDFVSHHPDWCSVHRNAPRKCAELGLLGGKGGALFLAAAAARGIDLSSLMKHLAEDDETDKLSHRLRPALSYLARGLHKVDFASLIEAESATGKAVARALLAALAAGNHDEAKLLAAMFKSDDCTLFAVALVVAEMLGWNSRDIYKAISD
jgi:hypothetical protein